MTVGKGEMCAYHKTKFHIQLGVWFEGVIQVVESYTWSNGKSNNSKKQMDWVKRHGSYLLISSFTFN